MKYQQWRETCTTAVLPQRYSVTRGVLVSSKQSSEAAIVTVLDASKQIFGSSHSNCIRRQQNTCTCEHSEGNGVNGVPNNSGSAECHPVNQKELHLSPNSLHPEPCSLPWPNPIEFLLFNNNTTSGSIFQVPGVPQLSALHSELPRRRLGNHLQLAIAPEWVKAANKN